MHGFVSNFTMRLDAKGRVSIPASFRAVLARDGFEGLYCYPSPHLEAVDAGGNWLLGEIEKRIEGLSALTSEHDYLATALYGSSEVLKIDGEGRVMMTETVKAHAGIVDSVVFVGHGLKFQIWEPQRFAVHRAEAMRRALAVLEGRAADARGGAPS